MYEECRNLRDPADLLCLSKLSDLSLVPVYCKFPNKSGEHTICYQPKLQCKTKEIEEKTVYAKCQMISKDSLREQIQVNKELNCEVAY
jgi:hypothetical protein